jgi:hypothetical protein
LGAATQEKHSPAFAIFQDPEMEHLYRKLREYAASNGDDGFFLEEKTAGCDIESALPAAFRSAKRFMKYPGTGLQPEPAS